MAGPGEFIVGNAPSPGSYVSPLLNFAPLSQLADSYYGGQQQRFQQQQNQRTLALQQAFPNGLPLGPDGRPDISSILNTSTRLGGVETALGQLPLLQRQQVLDRDKQFTDAYGTSSTGGPVSSPSAAGPANITGGQPAPAMPGRYTGGDNGQTTVMAVVTDALGADRAGRMAPNIARALRVDPNQPLNDETMTKLKTLVGNLQSTARGNVAPPQEAGTASMPVGTDIDHSMPVGAASTREVANNNGGSAPPFAPDGSRLAQNVPGTDLVPPSLIARGVTPQAYADALLGRAREHAIVGDVEGAKLWQGRAQPILEAIKQAGDMTDAQKNARASKMSPLEYETRKAEAEKQYGVFGEAKGKRVSEIIEGGGQAARHTYNTLNVMEEAINRAGNNISTGPGAESWLKVKQAAQNIFPNLNIKGLPETEVVVKLNTILAAEAAKAMTARPSQLEFQSFVRANPGLSTSIQGTKFLIGVLRQAKEQDIALGRLAMNQKNLSNWSDVEDRFFREHPIKSPFTGEPLIGGNEMSGQGQISEGRTATHPQTGERLQFRNGRWGPPQ